MPRKPAKARPPFRSSPPATRGVDYLPQSIYVKASDATDVLLDLEGVLEAALRAVAEERTRVLGLRPEAGKGDGTRSLAYWSVGLPQAIYDLLQHYSRPDVERVCVAFLANGAADMLSVKAKREFLALANVQESLAYDHDAKTYRFSDMPPEQEQEPADVTAD